jgi:hypothetical protein
MRPLYWWVDIKMFNLLTSGNLNLLPQVLSGLHNPPVLFRAGEEAFLVQLLHQSSENALVFGHNSQF